MSHNQISLTNTTTVTATAIASTTSNLKRSHEATTITASINGVSTPSTKLAKQEATDDSTTSRRRQHQIEMAADDAVVDEDDQVHDDAVDVDEDADDPSSHTSPLWSGEAGVNNYRTLSSSAMASHFALLDQQSDQDLLDHYEELYQQQEMEEDEEERDEDDQKEPKDDHDENETEEIVTTDIIDAGDEELQAEADETDSGQ